MRILVTGANGFVGRLLVQELINRGHQVSANTHRTNTLKNITHTIYFDLTNLDQVRNGVKESMPDCILHLAAHSSVPQSWDMPASTFAVNTVGTINLIEAIKEHSPIAKLISVGSGQEYGSAAALGKPLVESHVCQPQNPYALSKFSMGQIALLLASKYNLNIIHVRPFNHFGPGQQEGYVISDFASQISRIENSMAPPVIRVGNLKVQRDFTNVSDVVKAYILLVEQQVPTGIYNICTGIPYQLTDILKILLDHAKVSIEIKADHEKFRDSEVPIILGSPKKMKETTGWVPEKDLKEGILETLNWWRTQIPNKFLN